MLGKLTRRESYKDSDGSSNRAIASKSSVEEEASSDDSDEVSVTVL